MKYLGYAGMVLISFFPGYLAAIVATSVILGVVVSAFALLVMLYLMWEILHRIRLSDTFERPEGSEYVSYVSGNAGYGVGFGGDCGGGHGGC